MKSMLSVRLLAGAAAIACTATGAYAQDTDNSQSTETTQGRAASSGSGGFDSIVVTARRRAENIQDTPLAVTAITEEVLRQKAVSTPYDLVASTPGIAVTGGSATRNDVYYFIRGQGVTFGSSPSVVSVYHWRRGVDHAQST